MAEFYMIIARQIFSRFLGGDERGGVTCPPPYPPLRPIRLLLLRQCSLYGMCRPIWSSSRIADPGLYDVIDDVIRQ